MVCSGRGQSGGDLAEAIEKLMGQLELEAGALSEDTVRAQAIADEQEFKEKMRLRAIVCSASAPAPVLGTSIGEVASYGGGAVVDAIQRRNRGGEAGEWQKSAGTRGA